VEVIVIEKEAFNKLIEELTIRIIQNVERHYTQEEWIGEKEAKALLGISGRSTLQRLRDELKIEFSQFGRIIRYSRSSILRFLEQNRKSLDRL
jgi:hypothetical protein